MKHRAIWTTASFVVGCVLCFCAIVLTGAGHGTYIPLSLCASPSILVAMLPNVGDTVFLLGVFLAPAYWALLTWIATGTYLRRRLILVALLLVQYFGACLFVWWSDEEASAFAKVQDYYPLILGIFVIIYTVAQVLLWRSATRQEVSTTAASA